MFWYLIQVLLNRYLGTVRRSEYLEPEKALLRAILEDAIHNYRKYEFARDRQGKERFLEAKSWIMQTGNDWIFSFDNVCELLGLDPEFLRHELLGYRKTLETDKVQNARQETRN